MALKESFEKSGTWLFRYRGYLPVILLLTGTVMVFRSELYPHTLFVRNTVFEISYEMMCLFISLLGLGIRIYTVGYSPRNTSGRNVKGQVADSLNTTGIYSVVRHPLYLGNFLMWTGIAFLSVNLWFIISFMLLFWLYYERIMYAEEQYLSRKFGKDFETWANSTPAILPAFRRFKPSGRSFNWRKVLKKEKSGVLALFVVYTAFDVAGELLRNESGFNYFVIALCCISVVYYLSVKLLTRYTRVFSGI